MLVKGSLLQRFVKAKAIAYALGVSVFLSFLLLPQSLLAQTPASVDNTQAVANAAGIGQNADLFGLIGRIVNVVFGFVGILLLGYLLFAGYLWMTAGGDNDKVERARTMIKNALIGLLIIASAFAIVKFVLDLIFGAVDPSSRQTGSTTPPFASFPTSSGSLGAGLIEYHIPMRDAHDVARNTSIVIAFKVPIKLSSMIQGYEDAGTPADLTDDSVTTALNTGSVRVIKVDGTREEIVPGNQIDVTFTEDRQIFVLKPQAWLGSPTADTDYKVVLLPGSSGLLQENGSSLFDSRFPSGYEWKFQVGTQVDLTPPRITSVVPVQGQGTIAPNTVVQVNFSEPVNPVTASGIYRSGRGFSNLEVVSAPAGDPTAVGTRVEGEWRSSSRFDTVEFTTFDQCGVNACGRAIFCLPRNASVNVTVKTPTLSENPPAAQVIRLTSGLGSLFDGVVDLAGNALDGDGDGVVADDTEPDYSWSFLTSQNADLSAPVVHNTLPVIGTADFPSGSSQIPENHQPETTFGSRTDSPMSNILQASTVNSTNVYMTRQNEPREVSADTFWYTPFHTTLDDSRAPVSPGGQAVFGKISIAHRPYVRLPETPSVPPADPPTYAPVITSGVQNLLQNCFKPSASETCHATLGGARIPARPTCCDGREQSGDCSYATRTP